MPHPPKTWFITGASSGFGHAFAVHAIERGFNVVATARNVSALQILVAQAPDRVLALPLDVTQPAHPGAAVDQALERFGRIDVLINNAGYAAVGALEETPEDELRALMETNFFGSIRVIQAILPTLRAQRSGAIVNISSSAGQFSFAGFSAYSASKFAIEGASEALAQEMAPFGVKVLIVEPGGFRTELNGAGMREMPILDAYKHIVDPSRSMVEVGHGKQPGDPRKAASVIELALDAKRTPLHLPLGADSIFAIRAHAESLLVEMAQWEGIAAATNFTDITS